MYPSTLNLRPKVTFAVLAVSIVATGIAVLLAYAAMRETVTAEYQRSTDAIARGVAAAAKLPLAVGDADELKRVAAISIETSGLVRIVFRGRDGSVVYRQDSSPDNGPHPDAMLILGQCDVSSQKQELGDLDVFGTTQAESSGDDVRLLGSVQVGMPTSVIDTRMQSLAAVFIRIVVGAGIVIGAMMWLLAGSWTRRLDKLVKATERIATGDLECTLRDEHTDEIGRLADAFGRMRVAIRSRDDEARRFNQTLQEQVRCRTMDLEQAMHAAQAASRAKSDFLANMSHEIRTPMTAILGFADLLTDPGQTSESRKECVATINRSGRHLLNIINDILDISKIEAGRMTVEPVDCSPTAIISDAISIMQERANEKGIALRVVFDSPVPRMIRSDPLRLRQILINVVGNAMKFTERGSVTLRVSADRQARMLRFEVEDTGVGIAPDNIGRLFSPFSQSDDTMTRRFGGTGLGLSISRRFSQMLGGSLTLKHTSPAGSTFVITIETGPIEGTEWVSALERPAPAPTPVNNLSTTGRLAGFRILLAEDGVDNQRLLSLYLRKEGAVITMVENGRLARERLQEAHAAQQPFDVVLLDMQMPEMDGYTAARETRAAGDMTPIIALTAHALVGDRERCIAAGCSDYLAKPVNRTALVDACERWKHAGRHTQQAA